MWVKKHSVRRSNTFSTWVKHIQYVGKTHSVCGSKTFSMWVKHIQYVGQTHSVCRSKTFSMWVKHIQYVGQTHSVCGSKTFSMWVKNIQYVGQKHSVRGSKTFSMWVKNIQYCNNFIPLQIYYKQIYKLPLTIWCGNKIRIRIPGLKIYIHWKFQDHTANRKVWLCPQSKNFFLWSLTSAVSFSCKSYLFVLLFLIFQIAIESYLIVVSDWNFQHRYTFDDEF